MELCPVLRPALERRLLPLGNTFLNWREGPSEPTAKARACSFSGYVPFALQARQDAITSVPVQVRTARARPPKLELVCDRLVAGGLDEAECGTPTTLPSSGQCESSGEDKEEAPPAKVPEAIRHRRCREPKRPERLQEATTMVIQNLPEDISQADLAQELDTCGFVGLYDFMYMPSTFGNRRGKGYAFVNFLCPADAKRLAGSWKKSCRFGRSAKTALSIVPSQVQGRAANMAKWDKPKLRRIKNPDHRPLLPTAAARPAGQ